MNNLQHLYCDSSVFLSYLNAVPNRIEILRTFFEQITQDKNRKMITSVVSIVEVSNIADEKTVVKGGFRFKEVANALQQIDSFWQDRSLVEIIDISEHIAFKAREITRQGYELDYNLKNLDALHLASAKIVGAKEFLTYDRDFPKMAEITGLDIKEPYTLQPKLPGMP
jgi:predicted nucleic acid-binding protein